MPIESLYKSAIEDYVRKNWRKESDNSMADRLSILYNIVIHRNDIFNIRRSLGYGEAGVGSGARRGEKGFDRYPSRVRNLTLLCEATAKPKRKRKGEGGAA